ncbi:MAG: DUF5357 family protein [Chroococcales cyanobacterium]
MSLNTKNLLIAIFKFIKKLVTPPSVYSWETFVWLSAFSWFMSLPATGLVNYLLENFGFIFLIVGVAWAAKVNSLVIGPWITGALVSIFIFGLFSEDIPAMALVVWPIISGAIASIPAFVNESHQVCAPKPQKRQELVILWGSQLLISCWIQFFFISQTWLEQYPTFLAEDLRESQFMVVFNPKEQGIPRGVILLNLMAGFLQEQLAQKSWSEVEQWLMEEGREERIEQIKEKIIEQSPLEENNLWKFKSKATELPSKAGYNLHLCAIWQGVSPQEQTPYAEKTCAIAKSTLPETTILEREVATVHCEPANINGWGYNVIPSQCPSIIDPFP